MRTFLSHLQVNVKAENLGFYREILAFLGWNTLYEDETMVGAGSSNEASLWFTTAETNDAANDYDGRGVNHIAIGATSQAEVDETARYLEGKGIARLFETPRHREDFANGDGQTYYQVMFESPDRILFEVVYTGPKQD